MRFNETLHRTHRAHRTCVQLRRWENQRMLSSSFSCRVYCWPINITSYNWLVVGFYILNEALHVLAVISRVKCHVWHFWLEKRAPVATEFGYVGYTQTKYEPIDQFSVNRPTTDFFCRNLGNIRFVSLLLLPPSPPMRRSSSILF